MSRIRWFVMLTIVAVAAALTLGCNVEAAPDWSIKADVAESCSCNPVCPCLLDYTQHVSVVNRHEADDATWEYSKTNGFTSRIDSGS